MCQDGRLEICVSFDVSVNSLVVNPLSGAAVVYWLCWLRVRVGLVQDWVDGLASRKSQTHSCKHKLGYTKGGYLYAEVRCSYHLGKTLWSSASLTAHHLLYAVRWFLRALSKAARMSLACLRMARPWPASRVFSQSPPVCLLECNGEVWRCLHHAVPPLQSIRSSCPDHLQICFARTLVANPTWPHSLLGPKYPHLL